MSWNNAYEKRKFEAKQKKQAEKYRALGMTEEQIKEMYEFDYAQFKSERRFRMHTQSFEPDKFDADEDDNEKLSIVEKFQDVLVTTQDDSTDKSRYWWIIVELSRNNQSKNLGLVRLCIQFKLIKLNFIDFCLILKNFSKYLGTNI